MGRLFDDTTLKRSVIAACGNQLNSFYVMAQDMTLSDLLEALELVNIQNQG